jgi:hypothetical protein
MISSGVKNTRVGQVIGPMVLIVFLIFGGQIVNVNTTPVVFRWIRWVSPVYLSYSALTQNQFNQITFNCTSAPVGACISNATTVLQLYNLNDMPLWRCVLVNGSMAVAFLVIGFVLFNWRSRPLMKLK